MFDAYQIVRKNENNTTQITTCSGGIYKSCADSWFICIHLRSDYAKSILRKNSDEIVLQMVVCGEMEVMAEVIKRSDFENLIDITQKGGKE